MPVADPLFALLPAPEHVAPIELAVEIDQPFFEALEHAADLDELEHVLADLPRHLLDLGPQAHLLRRLAPLGIRLRGDELVARDEIAPFGVQGRDVGDDLPDQGESLVGLVEGEILLGHGKNLNGTWILRARSALRMTAGALP